MNKPDIFKKIHSVILDYQKWIKIAKLVKVEENEIGVICPYGIGDTYNACSLLKYFLKNNNTISLLMVVKPSQREIPSFFFGNNVKVVEMETPGMEFLFFLKQITKRYSSLKTGKMSIVHPYFFNNADFQKMGKNKLNIYGVYKKMLGIPNSIVSEVPIISKNASISSSKLFNELKLKKGHTVLIAPNANSIKEIPIEFWNALISQLLSKDIMVVINGGEFHHDHCVNVNMNLSEVIPFVNLAGYFISIRSGLCDLVLSAKCTKIIIYPDGNSSSGSIYSCYSIKKESRKGQVFEYIYKKTNDPVVFAGKVLNNIIL